MARCEEFGQTDVGRRLFARERLNQSKNDIIAAFAGPKTKTARKSRALNALRLHQSLHQAGFDQ